MSSIHISVFRVPSANNEQLPLPVSRATHSKIDRVAVELAIYTNRHACGRGVTKNCPDGSTELDVVAFPEVLPRTSTRRLSVPTDEFVWHVI